MKANPPRLALVASTSKKARSMKKILEKGIELVPPEQADRIVVLGGDGFMLRSLHQFQSLGKPVYGINCGTVGFLMNSPDIQSVDDLFQRLKAAETTVLHALKMDTITTQGVAVSHYAINEVSLLRQTHQAVKIRITVNGVVRLEELIGDGLIVATPAGSTAYNFSAHGPILPLGTPLLALTPLSPFRPRHWRGALLHNTAHIRLDILDADHRSISATADDRTVQSVQRVDIYQDQTIGFALLFDPGHNLETRILREQFIGF
ncbi:MAG: NAD kinase [Alphaproteobacteria bacterium]|nr:NAD kinase [Alphaproteobacteria bacterium]